MRYESYPTSEEFDLYNHGIIACYTVGHVINSNTLHINKSCLPLHFVSIFYALDLEVLI